MFLRVGASDGSAVKPAPLDIEAGKARSRMAPFGPQPRIPGTNLQGASRVTKLLDEKDVLRLLREDVDKAGGQSAWARQTGVDRVHLNKVLRGKRPLTRTILQVLKLKKVYTATPAAQMKTRRGRLSGRRRGSDG
jgi:DNA-binding phage protein